MAAIVTAVLLFGNQSAPDPKRSASGASDAASQEPESESAPPPAPLGDPDPSSELPPRGDEEGPEIRLVFHLKRADDGRPIPGGNVVLSGRFPSAWSPAEGLEFEANRDILSDEAIVVSARAPGFVEVQRSLHKLLASDQHERDRVIDVTVSLAVADAPALSIRVVDAVTSEPVAGAGVFLAGPWRRGRVLEPFARSGPDGGLTLRLDRHYGGQVDVVAEGYLPRRLPLGSEAVDAGDFGLWPDRIRGSLRVRVETVGAWSGLVHVVRAGPAMADAALGDVVDPFSRQQLADGVDPVTGSSLSEPWQSGERDIDRAGLWPGRFVVLARDDRLGCAAAEVELAPGGSAEVTLRIGDGCLVRPAASVGADRIVLQHEIVSSFVLEFTDAGVAHVPRGAYRVARRTDTGGLVRSGQALAVPDAGALEIVPPERGSVSLVGRLVDGNGRGVPGVPVGMAGASSATTDEEGRFIIPALSAGTYNLVAQGLRIRGRVSLRVRIPETASSRHELGDVVVGN
jgi:hypothetical protein